jgi:hypothetical protein
LRTLKYSHGEGQNKNLKITKMRKLLVVIVTGLIFFGCKKDSGVTEINRIAPLSRIQVIGSPIGAIELVER